MIYDVLIIGSGGAGLSCAIEASAEGAKVAVLSKTYPTKSQTSMAQGGINAPLGNLTKDSIELHIQDTLKSSVKFADEQMVTKMVKNAPKSIKWLDDMGVVFSRFSDGKIAQRRLGGASSKRACYAQDYTGLKILHSLYDTALNKNIDFFNEYMLLDLVVKDNRVLGVNAMEIKNSKIHLIKAKSVVMATGGYLAIYNNFTTNSTANTGDGVAVAYRCGAEISDMEFVQFHPTSLKNSKVLISESARGEGGILLNQKGERFVDELTTRDEVSREIFKQIQDGNEVFLDIRALGEEFINENLPQERKLSIHYEGVDPVEKLIPISPSAHYSMGGINVDENHQTNIEGLFAVGECANAKVHGANRLGGNSLLEIVVFGREAGRNATDFAKNIDTKSLNISMSQCLNTFSEMDKLFAKTPTVDFYQKKLELGREFFDKCGIFRDEKSLLKLKEFVQKIDDLTDLMGIADKDRVFNTNLVEYLEFLNIITIAKLVIDSAIERKESRGAHFRTDYPKIDEKFENHIVLKK